jgi:hypothetical protein
MELTLRPLMPDDAAAAREFVSAQFTNQRYRARALEVLESALQFDDPEYMALLALDDADQRIVGIASFGTVAGAHAVVKLHAVLAKDLAPAQSLTEAVIRASQHSGERMIVCELPDDPELAVTAAALTACGFVEQGRVPDFVRDGVALRFFVRPLLDPAGP